MTAAHGFARRWSALAIVACLVATAGCGFANKRANADRIRNAPARLVSAGGAVARFSVSAKVISSIPEVGLTEGASLGGKEALPVVFNYGERRSAVVADLPTGGLRPVLVADGVQVYQRRLGTQSTSAHPWVRLNLEDLYSQRKRMAVSTVGPRLISPVTLVDLLRGTLTGSVHADGHEVIDGVPTTRYRLNVDLDKAYKHAPRQQREAFEVVRALSGFRSVVHGGRVWLDDHGVVRRAEMRLHQQLLLHVTIELAFELQLANVGRAPAVDVPARSETASISDVSSLAAAMNLGRNQQQGPGTGSAGAGAGAGRPAPSGGAQ